MKFKIPFDSALKGASGEYEISRVIGGFGALAYCICANAFVGYQLAKSGEFDVTAYCLAFPGGLAGIIAAAAGSAAWKDKGTASAKIIEQTGTVPAPPPAGPQTPVGDPPPVDKPKEEAEVDLAP